MTLHVHSGRRSSFLLSGVVLGLTFVANLSAYAQVPATPGQEATPREIKRIRIGGNVQQAKIISQSRPVYPELAKNARIQGTVKLQAILGTDGRVMELSVLSGHPLLVQAALDAVRQWQYQPTRLNGKPVEVVTAVDVVFTLASDSSTAPMASPSEADRTDREMKAALAALDPASAADLRRLMELIYSPGRVKQQSNTEFEQMKPTLSLLLPEGARTPEVSQRFYEKFMASIAAMPRVEPYMVIYSRYFTPEEVRGLIAFYDSPLGQKQLETTSPILRESLAFFTAYLQRAIPQILEELRAEFPALMNSTPPDEEGLL